MGRYVWSLALPAQRRSSPSVRLRSLFVKQLPLLSVVRPKARLAVPSSNRAEVWKRILGGQSREGQVGEPAIHSTEGL
jgi:hypothetical protein